MIAKVVVGAVFGDEGKGTIVDYLAGQMGADVVYRFNGGAQTAHNVIHQGIHHTFSQWGSATLRGIPTYLGEKVLVDPEMAIEEGRVLEAKIGRDPWELVRVHPNAVIVTPWHRAFNRAVEDSRRERHGSCGMGIGAARDMEIGGLPTLRVGDLRDMKKAELILDAMHSHFREVSDGIMHLVDTRLVMGILERYKAALLTDDPDWARTPQKVVFEGAQGILLDETWGTAPHNTWTDCTPRNAMNVIPRMWLRGTEVVMVTRTYMTRHGFGPFPSESSYVDFPEPHNAYGKYQGAFRLGHLDFQALRYSLQVAKEIAPKSQFTFALTHFDKLGDLHFVDYADSGPISRVFMEVDALFASRLGEGIRYLSSGPTSADKRTMW